jgi:hypothetical protein
MEVSDVAAETVVGPWSGRRRAVWAPTFGQGGWQVGPMWLDFFQEFPKTVQLLKSKRMTYSAKQNSQS